MSGSNHLLEGGDDDEVLRTIEHHGRQINAIQGLRPRARRHWERNYQRGRPGWVIACSAFASRSGLLTQ
jgi:cysteinyl-tRNA synthetase